ncbi:DNA-methyltransferase [Methanolobus psychrotolerans]|uniref:DNA-methyltransferase n=1 Tax=Methanolobus psychrotolerans TaxID=1874706 RepID=UPI001A93833D|nr:site-specific DNA-methyltransferase [Methanolobus psychrotolerans]
MEINRIYQKSSEKMDEIDDNTVSLVVTSPPYNIDIKYGNVHKNGKAVSSKGAKYEDKLTEDEYIAMLTNVFNECKRVLKDDGSIWVNIKNRFSNGTILPPFWLIDIFDDMYLKNIIIWNFDWGGSTSKRFSSRYEYVFWFTKDEKEYIFNLDDVTIPALNYRPDRFKSQWKNPSDVWYFQMVSGNYPERTSHPAQYPEELIERIVKVASNEDDIVLDPFMGSGTTARVASDLGRKYLGYETNTEYVDISEERLSQPTKRKKKESKDPRGLYFSMDNHTLAEYIKDNKGWR